MKIMLVRHGKTAWNGTGKIQGHSDTALDEIGIEQAKLLAAHCMFDKVDAVYSSDLQRARVTAEILAEKFNLPVQTMPELREVNFGDWEGRTFSELEKTEPTDVEKFFRKPDELKINNAETFFEAQERAMTGIKKIIATHQPDAQIIVVAHGAITRAIICSVLEIPIRKMWALSQFNTAVNILRCDDGYFTVELINSTSHLLNNQN